MKKIVISGGSSGIGKSLVEKFSEKGWKVHFTFHSNELSARELERRFEGNVKAHKLDVANREACDQFCKNVLKRKEALTYWSITRVSRGTNRFSS